MNDNFIHLLWLSSFYLILFGTAELLYRVAKIHVEYTRKFVHIGTGLLTMLFPLMFTHYGWVIFICAAFFVVLSISLKFGFVPSINAIQRKSHGSLSYPVVVVIAFMFYYFKTKGVSHEYFYFYLPVLTMALADPLAAYFGSKFPRGKYSFGQEQKTLTGSLAFFIVALALSFFLIPNPNLFFLLVIPLVATVTEAITSKGLDNLTIPVSVIAVLYFYPNV